MRAYFRTTASATVLLAAFPTSWWSPAFAAAESAQTAPVEEIVVTGSRIVRDGFQSPTPMTVLGAQEIHDDAANAVSESLVKLPIFTGSSTSRSNNVSGSTGLVGVNTINLRALGGNRTLTLYDGQRAAGSDGGGALDINIIPSGLIKRVEVVTGGASAAYGSDAVTGVANFILDHEYTGVKVSLEGGITTYGDDEEGRFTITGGAPFAGGRGHVLGYAEISKFAGINGHNRPWYHDGYQLVLNPAYGTTAGLTTTVPEILAVNHVSIADAAPGSLITSGPLKGTGFGAGGTPFQLTYGQLVAAGQMIGGDWQVTNIDDLTNLDARQAAGRFFTRASYDVTDNFNVYASGQWSRTESYNANGSTQFNRGAFVTVSATNPMLPASLRATALARGVTSFAIGTTNADVGSPHVFSNRTTWRFNFGGDGDFTMFGNSWKFSTYFQHSQMKNKNRVYNDIITAYLRQSFDAVTNSAGQIVCRDQSNGCVPSGFGTGVQSAANIDFVTGTSMGDQYILQSSAEASVSGNPFSTWAGPVSVAAGVDWRKDSAHGVVSDLDTAKVFFFGNFAADIDEQSVKEVFGETVVPLAKDSPLAESVELNGAVRYTDYSLAGQVTTWKLGANYTPFSDIRFRATRSRDIRAPSLSEISPALRSTSGGIVDPLRNNEFVTAFVLSGGNPNLRPEIGDTLGLGAVISPSFISGLTMSADYYNIKIKNAIAGVGGQQAVTECANGNRPDLCPLVTRAAPTAGQTVGQITSVRAVNTNIAGLQTKGLDLEGAYSMPLSELQNSWGGNLTVRVLATHVFLFNNTNLTGTTQAAGGGNAPPWRYNSSIGLNFPQDSIRVTFRGISSTKISATGTECTTGCPPTSAASRTYNNNTVGAWHGFDLSYNHKLDLAGAATEAFFSVQNVLNAAPVLSPGSLSTPGYFSGQGTVAGVDTLGRVFHAGVRMAF